MEFADLELTDYNAPLLGPAAPREPKAAAILWRDLRLALRRLPGGADLIRFKKMPLDLQGGSNPLAMLDGAGPCSLNGNLVTTGEDFDLYKRSLEARRPQGSRTELARVYGAIPALHSRSQEKTTKRCAFLPPWMRSRAPACSISGSNFILNDEAYADFYRNLVRDGVGDGYAVVSALTVGDEVVATLLGVRSGPRYVMVRVSNAGDKWSNCSPGRLVIERTMAALHKDGVREFDFSVGNYAYKRRFGVTELPLVDISAALSLRGLPYALRDRAARELRNYPKLTAYLKRALGKPLSREEN